MPLALACSNEEKIKVTASPTTPGGNPATLDGGLQAEVISGDGTVEPDPSDPNSFFAVSGVALGITEFRVHGDAGLGSGVVEIQDIVTLTVGGAMAANFGLTASAPIPK